MALLGISKFVKFLKSFRMLNALDTIFTSHRPIQLVFLKNFKLRLASVLSKTKNSEMVIPCKLANAQKDLLVPIMPINSKNGATYYKYWPRTMNFIWLMNLSLSYKSGMITLILQGCIN